MRLERSRESRVSLTSGADMGIRHVPMPAKTLEDTVDPRQGNGFEDRDVMNDRTKPETASPRSIDLATAKIGDLRQPEGNRKVPNGMRRTRPSEPYVTWLGQSLRQSYEETLNEPVPDSFRELLNRLEQEDEDKSA
jgi:hypothetical protein